MRKYALLAMTAVLALSSTSAFVPNAHAQENGDQNKSTEIYESSVLIPEKSTTKTQLNGPLIETSNDSNLIQPYAYDIGGNGIIVSGPYKKTINNGATYQAASDIITIFSPLIPDKRIAVAVGGVSVILGRLIDSSKTIYVKTYYVRTYSSYDGMYIFKVAIEKYSDKNYTKAVSVDYYEIGRSTTTKLPGV